MAGHIHVGTSGWVYPHWRKPFYEGVPQSHWLSHYARFFDTVEINSTFYRLARRPAVERWFDEAPPDFLFAAKGSRFITHNLKLTKAEPALERFFAPLAPLRRRLAVVLWQLPPQMKTADPKRLDDFIALLPRQVRHAFEFRSAGWYTDDVAEILDRHGAAFCEHDLLPNEAPALTGGFRYLRFHGAGAKYAGRYGKRMLRPVAEELKRTREQGMDAFAFFNNDLHGHALSDAFDLLDLVGAERRGVPTMVLRTAPAPRGERTPPATR